MEILDVLHREFIYLRYYFLLQLKQIAPYWALGIKRFVLYIAFVMAFSLVTGLVVNLVV